jgi:hypothetical protein
MMLKKIAFFLLITLVLFSCSPEIKKGIARINGQVPEMAGHWIYLEELEVRRSVLLDSIRIDKKGNFSFKIELTGAAFFILRISQENQIMLLLDKDENIQLTCDTELLSNGCSIEGSPGSALLWDFEQFMNMQKQRVDSLSEAFYAHQGSEDFLMKKNELDSIYKVVFEDQRNYVINFINNNPGSIASLLVINRKLGNNKVMDEEQDFICFHRIDSALMIVNPTNKHTLDHHKRVQEIRGKKFDRYTADKKLQPGKKAPNIVLRDTLNHPVSLKSLTGKKVLVCFWAGWNAKSRQNNRKLLELYPSLTKNNIELFGVSLDENGIVWKGAVKLDRLPGIQGNDPKGLNSDAVKDYNLPEELPFYYFISEEQKIIFRDNDLNNLIQSIENNFNSFVR